MSQLIKQVPNDDSVLLQFAPMAGAVDLCVWDTANPGVIKCAGGVDSYTDPANGGCFFVDFNGLLGPATLAAAYLSDYGPFMMDELPCMSAPMWVNGHKYDGMTPSYLATVAPFTATPVRRDFSEALWFADYRVAETFTQVPSDHIRGPYIPAFPQWETPTSVVRFWQTIKENHFTPPCLPLGTYQISLPFDMHCHRMTAINAYLETAYGQGLHFPKQPRGAVLPSGTKSAVKFEIDWASHLDGSERRWLGINVIDFGAAVTNPAVDDALPNSITGLTADGNSVTVVIMPHDVRIRVYNNHQQFSIFNMPRPVNLNGKDPNIDRKHHFELYISMNRVAFYETDCLGRVNKIVDRAFNAALPISTVQYCFGPNNYHPSNAVNFNNQYAPGTFYSAFDLGGCRPLSFVDHFDSVCITENVPFP
jgi:hypothetical protein